ncbi:MAG: hypothetical protein Salg2KO_03680 [Salibacteraceae bacterium]
MLNVLNPNRPNLLSDQAMDEQLLRDGFIVMPFLHHSDLEHVKDVYKKWHSSSPDGFFKSYFDSRIEYKEEVEQMVIDLFNQRLADSFKNYCAFGGMFVVKPPLEKGHFPAHQDWSFVDERKHWSLNMWCPLEDVNDENGNIQVLRGSHQFNRTIRGFGTPDVYREHSDLILANMESVPMRAGEAIFFFHGILHGSTLNSTSKSRVSIGLTLTPSDADLHFHYLSEEQGKPKLIRYKTYPEFYIEYASMRGAKPGLKGEEEAFEFNKIDASSLKSAIGSIRGKVELPFEQHLDNESNIAIPWWQRVFSSV